MKHSAQTRRAVFLAVVFTAAAVLAVLLTVYLLPPIVIPANMVIPSSERRLSLPFTISQSYFKTASGNSDSIIIEMTQGKYYTAQDVPAGGGVSSENYVGKYRLRLINPLLSSDESTIFTYSGLEKDFDADTIDFSGYFRLSLADYNEDGNPDFTIGQWGGSNGTFYNLYSVIGNKIVKLDTHGMIYSAGHHSSVAFQKEPDKGFSTVFYDQQSGTQKSRYYYWHENQFQVKN